MNTILQPHRLRDALIKVGLVVLGVAIVGVFCRLGFWQLHRAEQKQRAFVEFQRRGTQAMVDLNLYSFEQPVDALLGYRAAASGKFHTTNILLDNQSYLGRPGYFIYTPFQLEGHKHGVLVNRGWVAMGKDRASLPDAVVDTARIRISGRVGLPPSAGLRLAGSELIERLSDNVVRVQSIEFERLASALHQSLVSYTLRLDETSPSGFTRKWRPPGSDEARHRGYALQWFAMAGALAVMMAVQLYRGWRRGR